MSQPLFEGAMRKLVLRYFLRIFPWEPERFIQPIRLRAEECISSAFCRRHEVVDMGESCVGAFPLIIVAIGSLGMIMSCRRCRSIGD